MMTLDNPDGKLMFAIRITTIDKVETCEPLVKKVGLFQSWMRIIKVYDRYYATDHCDTQLDNRTAIEHINGYIAQLTAEKQLIPQTRIEVI